MFPRSLTVWFISRKRGGVTEMLQASHTWLRVSALNHGPQNIFSFFFQNIYSPPPPTPTKKEEETASIDVDRRSCVNGLFTVATGSQWVTRACTRFKSSFCPIQVAEQQCVKRLEEDKFYQKYYLILHSFFILESLNLC